MEHSSIASALLATLLARRGVGTPIETETLLALSAIQSHEYVEAREVLDELHRTSRVTDHGFRGVELNDRGGSIADLLRDECGWKPAEIEPRLKHYREFGPNTET